MILPFSIPARILFAVICLKSASGLLITRIIAISVSNPALLTGPSSTAHPLRFHNSAALYASTTTARNSAIQNPYNRSILQLY